MRRLPFSLQGVPAVAGFPHPDLALHEPDGLLAVGGDLAVDRLLAAYRSGIFPWYSEGEPLLWWSPSRRAVFHTGAVHVGGRQRRALRNSGWRVRCDTRFAEVITACAQAPRPGQPGTWITPAMIEAYIALHGAGHAHSVEVFDGEALIGGLYGVAVGRMFCGESMFSEASGASTLALAALAMRLKQWGWPLIDAQILNAHTQRLGAVELSRGQYLQALATLAPSPGHQGNWAEAFGELTAAHVLA